METLHLLSVLLWLSSISTVYSTDFQDLFPPSEQISQKQGTVLISHDPLVTSPRLIEWLVLLGGFILYANMMSGNNQNLINMTRQIQSLSSELNETRYELFGKLEDNNELLNHTLHHWSLNFLNYIIDFEEGIEGQHPHHHDSFASQLNNIINNKHREQNDFSFSNQLIADGLGLQGNNLNLDEVVRRSHYGKRVRREAVASPDSELAEMLKGGYNERSHLEGQTVGSLLATIPAILKEEGETLSSISNNIYSLQSTMETSLLDGMSQLGEKLSGQLEKSLAPLKDLHDLHNLEVLPDKLSDHVELTETIHDGFDALVEKMADKTKIDDTLHDGLHEITEKLEQVNSYGLNGIMDQISKITHGHHYPYPVGGHGAGHGHDHHVTAKHGYEHLHGYLPAISSNLEAMIEKIGEHGELIADHLENNKEVATLKEIQEQQTNERILSALLDVAGSIDDGHEKVAEAVSTGHNLVSSSLNTGQEHIADTLVAGHTKISESLTAGHTKVAESNGDIATAISSGDQSIEEAITNTKESLDQIKGSVDMQSERLHNGLDSVVDSLKEAGQSNSEGLADISVKLQLSSDNIKTAGEQNKAGLDSLGTHVETVATNMADLKENLVASSAESKTALTNIATQLGTAAASSGDVATNLLTVGQDNKEGLENLKAAIREFQGQQTTDTTSIITALNSVMDGITLNSGHIKTELMTIGANILNAQGARAQLGAIRRLADKIECTTDCFTSDDQADAVIRGLDRTDVNIRDLVDDINNYASKGRDAGSDGRAMLLRRLLRQGSPDPGCYEAACDLDISLCHAKCSSGTAKWCRVERQASGGKVGRCVECWAHNQCSEPGKLRCDNTGDSPTFTCHYDNIIGQFLENDLKDTHVEWWRGYTDHLVHGLAASGGSLANLHSDRRTNEELITALVGEMAGSSTLNLLTGLNEARDAITQSLDGFVRRLDRKFQAIQDYATGVQSHIHSCTAPSGPCAVLPPTNLPLQPLRPIARALRRSLVFNNATSAEHQQTLDFVTETLNDPSNSQVDNIVLALLLSDKNIMSAVLGPVVEKFYQRLPETVVSQTESQGDHLKGHLGDQLKDPLEDHIFTLEDLTTNDVNIKEKELGAPSKNDPESMISDDKIVNDKKNKQRKISRRFSGKFSGISDLLSRQKDFTSELNGEGKNPDPEEESAYLFNLF